MSDAGVPPPGNDLRRWTASLLVVLAAHVAGGAALLAWQNPADSAVPSGAVMIDLAPLPEPEPEPPPELEPPPPAPAPEVAVSMPPPRIKPKPPERRQPVVKPVEQPPPTPAPAAPPAAAAPAAPAPVAAAPSGGVRTWQGEVLAHLERLKRYPRSAQARRQQGVVHVRFVIDRQGKVLSRSLERGSGVAALDEETLALVERADPLPTPPADMAQARIELVVPVVYAIK